MSDLKTNKSEGRLGWLLLLFISFIYFFANMQKVLVPGATFNELQSLFRLDATQVTRLGSAFMYVYAFMQLVAGVLADRFSGRRVIAVGGIVFCMGALLSAWPASLGLLVVGRILTGFGAATVYLSAVKEIGSHSPTHLPVLVGVLIIIGYSGGIAGTTPFIAGVHAYGYHAMMLAAAVGGLVAYLLFLAPFTTLPGQPVNRQIAFRPSTYMVVFKVRQNPIQICGGGITFGTYFALQTVIGKKFLEDYCGMSPHGAGLVLTVMMIIAASNSLILAALSRMWGNRRLPFMRFGGFGCMASGAILFTTVLLDSRTCIPAIAAMLLLSFAANYSSISVSLLKDLNDEARFGTVMSVSNFIPYLVTAVFGGSLGWLMDRFPPTLVGDVKIYGRNSYLLVFGVLLVLGAIAAFLSCLLKDPKRPS